VTAPAGQVFDTHAHIVSTDPARYPPAERYRSAKVTPFTVEQLVAGMDENDVTRACVVQRYHYYLNDNSYVLDACRSNPDLLTPVVILDGNDTAAPDLLRCLVDRQPIGGVRFGGPAMNSYDTAWLNSPGVMRLWEQAAELRLPVAVIMFEPHASYNLPALRLIAETFPDLQIVIDHLGTLHGASPLGKAIRDQPHHPPYICPPDFGVTPALRELSECANVNYKFTGINLGLLESDSVDAAAFLRYFVDLVGMDRVVCGSDIGQTRGPYERILGGLRSATVMLSEVERELVLYGNANRIYSGRPA
jgi:L-fuconolactonase